MLAVPGLPCGYFVFAANFLRQPTKLLYEWLISFNSPLLDFAVVMQCLHFKLNKVLMVPNKSMWGWLLAIGDISCNYCVPLLIFCPDGGDLYKESIFRAAMVCLVVLLRQHGSDTAQNWVMSCWV